MSTVSWAHTQTSGISHWLPGRSVRAVGCPQAHGLREAMSLAGEQQGPEAV